MLSHRYHLIGLIAVLFISVMTIGTNVSADTCPTGSVAITAATRQAATDAGIPASSQCWQPQDTNVGQSVGQAKEELATMRCGASVNTSQLGPKFSVCADKFMKALRAQSPTACIESAFRDPTQQAAACRSICGQLSCPGKCAAPGKSYHQKGLAIDIGKLNMPLQKFWQLASQSGLGNPVGLHSSDPNHIQVMNGGADCADIGYQPTTDDAFVPGPIQSNPYFNYGPSPLPSMPSQSFPTTPISQPSIPQSTPVATTPSTPTSPTAGICTPQFSCSNNVMYYQTTSCTTQVYQNCAGGCAGNSCAVITPSTGTSSLVATTTTTHASSTEELLNAFANPVSITTAPIGTASPIALALNNSTSHDVTQITVTGSSTTIINPGTIASIQPISAQQTFTTSDLSGNNSYSYNTQSTVGASKILSDLKAALTWALNFLTGRKSQ